MNYSKSLILTLFLSCTSVLFAEVVLPKIFGNNMVLQRRAEVPVWGTAAKGEKVTVTFAGQTKSTIAGDSGKWSIKLSPMEASETPRDLRISGTNTITLSNILVGEVWLCSGQSNMEYAMRKYSDYQSKTKGYRPPEDDLDNAHNTRIRIFLVRRKFMAPDPTHAGWNAAMGRPLVDFSAVGYYFAKNLYQQLHVPIGMISSAVPGSRIEPWIEASKLDVAPKLKNGTTLEKLSADGGDPGKFYTTMIQPLIPFAIKGFLWYQGESNCFLNENIRYAFKFKSLIDSWRTDWGNKNLPFIFVQIAPFAYSQSKDVRPHTVYTEPEFWESQELVLKLPHTAMVSITDLEDSVADLHPGYKWEVGRRLCLTALNRVYGQKNTICSGPVYKSMKIAGNTIELSFENVGTGLASRDGKPLTWFEVAGTDGKYIAANAVIKGDKIVVSSPRIAHPVKVRFGWNEAARTNFVNKDGLPGVPFRSDNPWENIF